MIIATGSLDVSLPLRTVTDEDDYWISSQDAALVIGSANASTFTGSTKEKRQFCIEGEDQVYVSFAYFIRSVFTNNKPGASIIADRIIQQLRTMMSQQQQPSSSFVPSSPAMPQLPVPQARQSRYGRQPFLNIISQLGIGRDRAKEIMDALEIDGVPLTATTFSGQVLGEATVKDATAVRAAVWLKMPITQLFTSWRAGDVRYASMENRLDDDVIMRVLSEAGVPHVA